MAFEELRKKYLPTVDPDNTIAFAGYGQVASMAEILRRCGDDLTRANVLKHATTLAGFHSPYFLDGVNFSYTPDDYTPMKTLYHLAVQRQGLGHFRQAGDGVGARPLPFRLRGAKAGREALAARPSSVRREPLARIAARSRPLPRRAGRGDFQALDEAAPTAYLLRRAVARSLALHAARNGCAAARPLPALVRLARLVAARASVGAAGKGPRRSFGAADCADRRRQDAGRISADAGGAFCFRRFERRRREEPRLHRPRREAHRRPAHPLHLAAEGARRRHRAQSGDADCRDGAADQGRDPHRRYAGVAAAAAAALSAGHSAHHAGATGAVVVVGRRAVSVLLAQTHRARRTACARHLQARRSAVARTGAAVAAGAGDARDRPVGDGGRAGIAGAVSGAAARRQGSRPPTSSWPAARRRPLSRCSTPRSACPGPATPRAMRSAKCTT